MINTILGEWFSLILIGYSLIYVITYFWRVIKWYSDSSFDSNLKRIVKQVKTECDPSADDSRQKVVQRFDELLDELGAVEQLLSHLREKNDEPLGDESEESLTLRWEQINLEIDGLQVKKQELALNRLDNLNGLHSEYKNPFVAEASLFLRSSYPQGNYQGFDAENLPSVQQYRDHVSSARSMAGLFVLFGLLGTMIKLALVVLNISDLTETGTQSSVEFLSSMGILMGNMQFAFLNSIFGVILMIVALLAISFVNLVVSRRINLLAVSVSTQIIPALSGLHNRVKPDLTLADLLRNTGDHIGKLNSAVENLAGGMTLALGGLGDQISDMLSKFGSYERHYSMMSDWVGSLSSATQKLDFAASGLSSSAEKISMPISEVNDTLTRYLALQVKRQDPDSYSEFIDDLGEVFDGIRTRHETALGGIQVANASAYSSIVEMTKSHLLESTKQVELNRAQMQEVAKALRESAPEKMLALVKQMDSTLSRVGDRMESSSQTMLTVSGRMKSTLNAPSLFTWIFYEARPSTILLIKRMVSKLSGR